MVNKANLQIKIAELVKLKKIDGITDIRDESNREGVRVVIELRKDANANVILNQLYKHTQLQDTFGVIMLALVNNEPKVLNLLEVLNKYLMHQEDVVTRRTRYDLNEAESRDHILQGLLKALDFIDEVISIIRGSATPAEAIEKLISRFGLDDIQAKAIVDMRLRALTGLERDRLLDEHNKLVARIEELRAILADEKLLLGVIKKEIIETRDKYGDERHTHFSNDVYDISDEEMIPHENTVIAMTRLGYIKRMSVDNFKAQNRGGKGIKGMATIEDDYVEDLLMTTTHHSLNFFTTAGRVYRMKAYEIPECSRTSRGVAIVNLLQLEPGEKVSAIIPIWGFEEGKNLFIATKNGTVKKMKMNELMNVRKSGLRAITLVEGNELIDVKITDADSEILLATKQGMCIRFREEEVRTTGRGSIGVIGMNLSDGDEVVAMQLASQGKYMTFISEKGMGKRTDIDEFNGQHRAGKGVKCYKITEKTGDLLAAKAVNGDEELIMITDGGQMIRIRIDDISVLSRITSGVKLMNLPDGEKIANVAKVRDRLSNGEKEFASLEEGEEAMDKESENMAVAFEDEDDEEVTLPVDDSEEDE